MPGTEELPTELARGLGLLSQQSPVLEQLIAQHGPYRPRRADSPDVFASLTRAIVYQQLAGKAAATIHGRFTELCGGRVTPDRVRALALDQIRAAGLSRAKCAAVLDLARHAEEGLLVLSELESLDDATLTQRLCRVRGIGPWTAQMFLIFELGRLDVWPTGDLAVRKGFGRAFGLPAPPTPRELATAGEPFRPYRSLVAWYCWRVVDTLPPR